MTVLVPSVVQLVRKQCVPVIVFFFGTPSRLETRIHFDEVSVRLPLHRLMKTLAVVRLVASMHFSKKITVNAMQARLPCRQVLAPADDYAVANAPAPAPCPGKKHTVQVEAIAPRTDACLVGAPYRRRKRNHLGNSRTVPLLDPTTCMRARELAVKKTVNRASCL